MKKPCHTFWTSNISSPKTPKTTKTSHWSSSSRKTRTSMKLQFWDIWESIVVRFLRLKATNLPGSKESGLLTRSRSSRTKRQVSQRLTRERKREVSLIFSLIGTPKTKPSSKEQATLWSNWLTWSSWTVSTISSDLSTTTTGRWMRMNKTTKKKTNKWKEERKLRNDYFLDLLVF